MASSGISLPRLVSGRVGYGFIIEQPVSTFDLAHHDLFPASGPAHSDPPLAGIQPCPPRLQRRTGQVLAPGLKAGIVGQVAVYLAISA